MAGIIACSDSMPIVPKREAPPPVTILGAADNDSTMGTLSELARHISAALQDPRVRGAVVRAMKDSVNNPVGIDLASCVSGTIARNVLLSGELRGGRDASSLCDILQSGKGALLYMDRDRLAGWDSTTIPVVTAIAKPGAPLPKSFHGYRSPDMVMDVPSDGTLSGPVLVIVPLADPHSPPRHSMQPLKSEAAIIVTPHSGINATRLAH